MLSVKQYFMSMKTSSTLLLASAAALLSLQSSSDAAVINLSTGSTAAQSTQLGGFGAGNALDALINFTHTQSSDANPTWQVLLPDSYSFTAIEAFNRASSDGALDCCPSRFRDITIQVLNFSGDATTDFTGGSISFSSALLNPENAIGGGTNTDGPVSLAASPGGAVGNMIRIIRTVDTDLSGSGGLGNADEGAVLSMDLVTAEGSAIPEPSSAILGMFGLLAFGLHRRR